MIFEHKSKNKKLLFIIFTAILIMGIFYLIWSKFIYQPESGYEDVVLPEGYTIEAYSIEQVLDEDCFKSSDCETPGEYLILSRCPFTSICLKDKCTVICPAYVDLPWSEAEEMINNCEVEKLSQRHNRLVKLFLKDDRQLQSIEPELDRIIDLVYDSKEKCGEVRIMTE